MGVHCLFKHPRLKKVRYVLLALYDDGDDGDGGGDNDDGDTKTKDTWLAYTAFSTSHCWGERRVLVSFDPLDDDDGDDGDDDNDADGLPAHSCNLGMRG